MPNRLRDFAGEHTLGGNVNAPAEEFLKKENQPDVPPERCATLEFNEHVNVAVRPRLVARYRAEERERLHTERVDLGSVGPQQLDDLVSTHGCSFAVYQPAKRDGHAVVSIAASSRSVAAATSSTAASNAGWFRFEGTR